MWSLYNNFCIFSDCHLIGWGGRAPQKLPDCACTLDYLKHTALSHLDRAILALLIRTTLANLKHSTMDYLKRPFRIYAVMGHLNWTALYYLKCTPLSHQIWTTHCTNLHYHLNYLHLNHLIWTTQKWTLVHLIWTSTISPEMHTTESSDLDNTLHDASWHKLMRGPGAPRISRLVSASGLIACTVLWLITCSSEHLAWDIPVFGFLAMSLYSLFVNIYVTGIASILINSYSFLVKV